MTATSLSRPAQRQQDPRPARHTRASATISDGESGQRRAKALHQPRHGEPSRAEEPGTRWATIVFMVVIHALAVVALLPRFRSAAGIATFLILYWVTACLGVTIGYHRLLAHRSFRVPRWLERFFATCGALSCQHGPIEWVGLHRHHHKFSDTDVDHHDSNKGFWWAHMGWMLTAIPAAASVPRLTGDLAKDPYMLWLDRWFLGLQVLLGLVLFAIGSVADIPGGGWGLVLWGVPLRLVVVYHCTWLVNSATHCWGKSAHDSGDNSRNNPWVAAVTFGEGWHNNHHAYPHSARHGFGPQIDLTWQHIRLMRALGLATAVRVPSAANPAARKAARRALG